VNIQTVSSRLSQLLPVSPPCMLASGPPFMTDSGRNLHWKRAWSAPPVVSTHCRSCDQRTLVTWAEWPMYFLNFAPWNKQTTQHQTSKQGEESVKRHTVKEEVETFPQTGEAIELHEAEVVPGNQHSGGVVGIHCVDLG